MDPTHSLPPQSAEIFDLMSKGLFISHNTPAMPTQDLFNLIELHEEAYKEYFQVIGYQLEKGEGYYYFSRTENKSSLEDKVEKLFRYLDGMEVLYLLFPSLSSGTLIKLDEVEQSLSQDKQLSRKALRLNVRSNKDSPVEKVKSFCKALEKESFLLNINDKSDEFLVLDAFQYLVDLFVSIDNNS